MMSKICEDNFSHFELQLSELKSQALALLQEVSPEDYQAFLKNKSGEKNGK